MALTRQDFLKIIKNYDVGKYKRFKPMEHGHAALAFSINTTTGTFLLKAYNLKNNRSFTIDLDKRKFQVKVMNILNEAGIVVPQIIATKSGALYIDYRHHRIFLQRYIDGHSVKNLTNPQIKELATIVGKINIALQKVEFPQAYVLPEIKRFSVLKNLVRAGKIDLAKRRDSLLKQYKKLELGKLTRSLTHNDMREDNIIVHKKSVVGVIDWDDLGETALSYDLGVIIYSFFIRENGFATKQIRSFLAEYQKYIQFNNEERKAVYYFAFLRILEVIAFFQWKKSTSAKNNKKIESSINNLARRYITLEKVGVKWFVSLF